MLKYNCSSHHSDRLRPRCWFLKWNINGIFGCSKIPGGLEWEHRSSFLSPFVFSISCVTPHSHAPLSSFVLSSANRARGGTQIHTHLIWIWNKLWLKTLTPKALEMQLQENGSLTFVLTVRRKQKKYTRTVSIQSVYAPTVTQNKWEISQLQTHTLLWLCSLKLIFSFSLSASVKKWQNIDSFRAREHVNTAPQKYDWDYVTDSWNAPTGTLQDEDNS